MLINVFVVLLIYVNIRHVLVIKLFEERADDLFESILGGVYNVTHNFSKPVFGNHTLALAKEYNMEQKSDYKVGNKTVSPDNITLDKILDAFKYEYQQNNVREIIKRKESPIPVFQNNVDDFVVLTRRFDDMKPPDGLNSEEKNTITRGRKVIDIMHQFIYATRYRLPYAQRLRQKYKNQRRYKFGYCFSLLRNLQQQQMILLSNMKTHYKFHTALYFHMTMYEKITQLDIDIKDLIRFIKKLEHNRKVTEDPNYFDKLSEAKPDVFTDHSSMKDIPHVFSDKIPDSLISKGMSPEEFKELASGALLKKQSGRIPPGGREDPGPGVMRSRNYRRFGTPGFRTAGKIGNGRPERHSFEGPGRNPRGSQAGGAGIKPRKLWSPFGKNQKPVN